MTIETLTPGAEQDFRPIRAISQVLGWTYFLCWSLSFYPQPLLNWRRKSVHGLAADYPFLNVLGFTAYTISTASFSFSATIRDQYAYRHPSAPESTVRFNDFVFAFHALVLCVVTYSQFYPSLWRFELGPRQRASRVALGVFWGSMIGVFTITIAVETQRNNGTDTSNWAWIDVIYSISYIKLICTLVKYTPQVLTNYKRRSTEGWSIAQVLLDFAGGVLSVMQLIIDSWLQGDWSGLTGNPVKLLLGNVSILFDLIFCYQHYMQVLHMKPATPASTNNKVSLYRHGRSARPAWATESEEHGRRRYINRDHQP